MLSASDEIKNSAGIIGVRRLDIRVGEGSELTRMACSVAKAAEGD